MKRLAKLPAVLLPAGLGLLMSLAAASPAVRPARAEAGPPTFALPCEGPGWTETAAAAGIDFRHDRGGKGEKHLPETMGSGVAWLDFDGDGWMDLYAVQSGPFPPPPEGKAGAAAGGAGKPGSRGSRLYRNLGGGRFEDWTERAGAGDLGYGQGVLAADLDGDGWTDLYITRFGRDRLLLNRGDGTFEDAEAEWAPGGWSSSAAAADHDGDGDLDLYVTRYLEYDPEAPIFCGDPEEGIRSYCDPSLFEGSADYLYVNEGRGAFRDGTAAAGLSDARGRGLGVVFTDLDGDARPDLYVANDLTLNLLFHNRGDGTFEDLSLLSGAAVNLEGKAEAGMGIAVGDVNGDGLADLAVTNFDVETNTLYQNLGELFFDDVSAQSGFGPPSFNLLGFGIAFDDFDLDGDLDAWSANGHIFEDPLRDNVHYAQPDLLLTGDGRGRFASQACGVTADGPVVGRGLAVADYDGDGDADAAVSNSDGPLVLYRNEVRRGPSPSGAGPSSPGPSYLGVSLRGAGGNSAAVGARIGFRPGRGAEEGPERLRWVRAGDSYQSTSSPRRLFAVPEARAGEGAGSDSVLEVRWPSGRARRLVGLPANAYLVIPEEP